MKTYEISSAQNKTFKLFKSLLTSKGIIEHGQALIFGKKAVEDTLREFSTETVGIIYQAESTQDILAASQAAKTLYRLPESLFKEIDIFGSHEAILLMKVPPFKKFESSEDGCYLLLSLQDPSNMGAMLRSAAAFGVKGILLAPGASHPFHPRSSRSASAGLFHHSFYKVSQDEVQTLGIPLIGLDKNGEPLSKFIFPKKFIFVLGAEGPGLNEGINLDYKLGIPIKESVDSLNAPVAASIALYQWSVR